LPEGDDGVGFGLPELPLSSGLGFGLPLSGAPGCGTGDPGAISGGVVDWLPVSGIAAPELDDVVSFAGELVVVCELGVEVSELSDCCFLQAAGLAKSTRQAKI
jgi:hypothetical protein